jgi:predicted nucleotidyltransferase component of viral defense system
MIPLAFQGGTALRFLYSIQRYSEDLDFALERPDRGYAFRSWRRIREARRRMVRQEVDSSSRRVTT